jgi:hypothetical protein
MANPNELSVELRLKMDQVRRDAQRAGSEVNKGLASSVKGLPPTVTEQQDAKSVDNARRAAIARARRNAQMDLKDDINEASRRNRARALIRQRDEANTQRLVEEASRRNRAAALIRQRDEANTQRLVEEASRRNRARALIRQRDEANTPRLVEEASRRNRAAALWRQRREDRESQDATEADRKKKSAQWELVKTAAIAVGAFLLLKKALSEVGDAANRAAQTYAKILQSGGMASGFVVKREQLARIIGVSEDQVMQYGAAIGYLNSRLEWSTKIFTETNPTLTALSWNMRIVQNDFEAMAAKITNAVAPALNHFLDLMDGIIKKSGTAVADVASDAVKNQQVFDRALQFMDKVNGKGNSLYPNINTQTGQVSFASSNGQLGNKAQEELQKQFQAFLKGHPLQNAAPQAPISLNRFPASDWQKMGLVIGGGGVNPQEKTAQHTAKMVTQLQTITTLLQPRTGNTKNPANVLANPMYPQP